MHFWLAYLPALFQCWIEEVKKQHEKYCTLPKQVLTNGLSEEARGDNICSSVQFVTASKSRSVAKMSEEKAQARDSWTHVKLD
jgi:hypothetical protein